MSTSRIYNGTTDQTGEKEPGPRAQKKTQKLKKVVTLPTAGLESFPFTDMGNGERMAHFHGDTIRHCHPWKEWLVWDGQRWAVDQRARVLVKAKELTREMFKRGSAIEDPILRDSFLGLARATEKAARTNSMLYFAAAQPGIPVMPDELDADPWLLNVQNGTLNLNTGELQKHNPDDLITKLAPAAYNPDARCPQWELFQRQIMADDQDVIAFKQRAIGYSLTGLAVEKRALFIYHGKGNNGKSTEAETLRAMLGDYAGQIRVESLMEQRHRDGSAPSPDIADLRGLRYVTASEPKEGARLEESTVKHLTSMSRIKARQLHAGNFEFPQTWKLFLDCNEKPVITGTDDGIWSRIALIPFTVQVGDGCELPIDPDLPDKLRGELPGILAWAVRGCMEWYKRRLKLLPKAVEEATKEYRLEQDIFGRFLSQKCSCGRVCTAMSSELYSAYENWLKTQHETGKEKPISVTAFGLLLRKRGFTKVPTAQGIRWDGVALASEL